MITIVAGLGRCGSRLMMAMLHAGGMQVYSDEPSMPYETEHMVLLPAESEWMQKCEGKAVKILDPHKFRPPVGSDYRVIWMDRNPTEQAKSQIKFLHIFFPSAEADSGTWAKQILPDTKTCLNLFIGLNAIIMRVRFESLIQNPRQQAERVSWFCGGLNIDAMTSMVVDRQPGCLPYMLELQLLNADQLAQ